MEQKVEVQKRGREVYPCLFPSPVPYYSLRLCVRLQVDSPLYGQKGRMIRKSTWERTKPESRCRDKSM